MTEGSACSYDDHPESDMATVLQVPLLWPTTGTPGSATRPGRHRAGTLAGGTATIVPTPAHPPAESVAHPLLLALEVGLASALIVLALFGLALFALARWMP